MSHLTTSLFHKPSPYDLPRSAQIPTPPDTDVNFFESASTAQYPASHAPPADYDTPPSQPPLPRRVSTLSYHNTGLRESRERSGPRPQSKWLVIVTPPASIAREHGQLGHTLSSGPPGRLSQGVLLPLFPTMYAQLTVIAREFNFPSTTGLCLYLGMPENNLSMIPRISDETWPILWNHLFEARSPVLQIQQLPVCGRIEFDIDLDKARWYDAWLASSRRTSHDVTASIAPSLSHWRDESKTTHPDDLGDEESAYVPQQTRTAIQRHVPRKLSLLDRLESASVMSAIVPPSENALPPIVQEEEPPATPLRSRVKSWRASSSVAPTPLAANGQISLDPVHMPNAVVLVDTPSVSTVEGDGERPLNLDDYAWSVSSLGPPDHDDLDSPVSWSRVPSVHLDRRMEGSVLLSPSYATSFGPDDDYESLYSFVSRLPSPDIAMRMLEDVPPTPSTATSWGPRLDYPPSPLSISRPPSVDIAYRAMSSRPATPSTATSWGPSSWPASPAYSYPDHRAPSLDLGERADWSRPVTPSTATSWGPPSYPPSPAHLNVNPNHHAQLSPDLGERGGWSRPVTPSTATSWGAPSSYPPSPFMPEHIPTPDAGHRAFDANMPPLGPSGLVFPYFRPSAEVAWPHVWPLERPQPPPPVVRISSSSGTSGEESTRRRATPPPTRSLEIERTVEEPQIQTAAWQHGAPHDEGQTVAVNNDVASAAAVSLLAVPKVMSMKSFSSRPKNSSAGRSLKSGNDSHPFFNLRSPARAPKADADTPSPSVPSTAASPMDMSVEVSPNEYSLHDLQPVILSVEYPNFAIYRTAYPNFEIYPGHVTTFNDNDRSSMSITLPRQYPSLDIYPAVYPNFEIYPGHLILAQYPLEPVSVHLPTRYPAFNIYPGVYPHLVIYPSVSVRDVFQFNMPSFAYPDIVIYPSVGVRAPSTSLAPRSKVPVSTQLRSAYPHFDIYPAGYPENVYNIYPRMGLDVTTPVSVKLPAQYPTMEIYPAAYPYVTPYPAVARSGMKRSSPSRTMTPQLEIYPPGRRFDDAEYYPQRSVRVRPAYPCFDLYPSVYPAITLYAPIPGGTHPAPQSSLRAVNHDRSVLPSTYPHLNIYPAVYPYFEIYAGECCDGRLSELDHHVITLPATYPRFDLYPAVYPHFEIYAGEVCDGSLSRQDNGRVTLPAMYPCFAIYPAAYPHFEIYAGEVCDGSISGSWRMVQSTLQVCYPRFDIYPAVYPHFDIYRSGSTSKSETPLSLSVQLPARYPAIQLYPPVYPHFELWPSVSVDDTQAPLTVPRTPSQKSHTVPRVEVSGSNSLGEHHTRSRKTHRRLHNEIAKTGHMFLTMPVNAKKTHRQLHNEAFRTPSLRSVSFADVGPSSPEGSKRNSPTGSRTYPKTSAEPLRAAMKRPAGLPPVPPMPAFVSAGLPPLPPSSGPPPQSALPPLPSRIASPSSPSRRPASQASSIPAEPAWEMVQPTRRMSDIRVQTSSLRRVSSARQPPSVASNPLLSPVNENPPVLHRSKSHGQRTGSDLSESGVESPRLAPRRRESLVLEKARMFDLPSGTPANEPVSRLSMSALSEFPLPPSTTSNSGAPGRPVGKLDRTRFSFQ